MQLSERIEELRYYLPLNGSDAFLEAVTKQSLIVFKSNKKNPCDIFDISDAIVYEELEKAQQAKDDEQFIDFNDEVASITDLGDMDLMDITVTRDNLFYANNILTKNSMGVPATADFMLSLSRTEELDQMGQLLAKQIKSRYGKKTAKPRFVIGVDLDTQKLFDVNQDEQKELMKVDDTVRNKNGSTDTSKFRDKFAGIKV